MSDDRKEPSSPACLAHEADDAYMGFATEAEIAELLSAVCQVDAGELVDKTALTAKLRKMLPKLRDDTLHRELAAKLAAYEGR